MPYSTAVAELGARDNHTFKRFKSSLDNWGIGLVCSDYFPVYDSAYPVEKHYIGKDQIVCLETNNDRQRTGSEGLGENQLLSQNR